VAGATPLNVAASRYSSDIDVFRDREERVIAAALSDTGALRESGYGVAWLRQLPWSTLPQLRKVMPAQKLECVVDSDYRFFPTMRDEILG
jgi:hypothetical protein